MGAAPGAHKNIFSIRGMNELAPRHAEQRWTPLGNTLVADNVVLRAAA